jgi:predicted DNA-binding protein (MmcQ/YjbR family)
MVSVKTARKIALDFEETDEKPHADRIAFRVKGKIFSTLSEENKDVNLKLTPFEQSIWCKVDPEIIHPVAGGWGRQGWTTIHLTKTSKAFFIEVIRIAYCNIAPLKLAEKYRQY